MKHKLIITACCLALGGFVMPAKAQPGTNPYWKKGGSASLNLNQVSLSNWAAGGDNAIGFNAQVNYFIDYKKNKHLWSTNLNLEYGLNRTKSDGTKKSNDKIYLSSKYGYELAKTLYFSALVTFQSQFAKGYDYGVDPHTYISDFMSPGYLLAGVGLTWTPRTWISATFTPAAWRGTFVTSDELSDAGQFGVDPGKHHRTEFGANLLIEARYEFLKNMTIGTKAAFYSNYLDKPQNIDVNWDVQLSMQINKWFATTVTTSMIYDDDTKILQNDGRKIAKLQFKEALAVGVQFVF